jgi:hypothetical protein
MAKDNETEATDSAPANDGPLMLEGPKAAADTPIIDLEAVHAHNADESAASEDIAPEHNSRWRSYAPLAAAILCAAAIGAVAGAATTSGLMRDRSSTSATADVTHALQNSVAQLNSELAALKTGITNVQRNSTTQFGKLTERLDRSDKALAEPVAKLAKIQESLDRLDRKPQQTTAAAAPASDITGSIAPPKTVAAKEESKPQIAEGWMLRDFYDGRAIVESRNGTLFRIGPGSNVPGLGKVESIKRENGKIVVLTAKGTISASIEQRRPGYYDRW